jgi:hypothetical protein
MLFAATDPSGFKVWLIFLAIWVTFWATAGGIVCHVVKGRGRKGALFGAVLAIVGILLVLVDDEEPGNDGGVPGTKPPE